MKFLVGCVGLTLLARPLSVHAEGLTHALSLSAANVHWGYLEWRIFSHGLQILWEKSSVAQQAVVMVFIF